MSATHTQAPTGVKIAAALLIYQGTCALVLMLTGLIYGGFKLDLSCILLPAGHSLLRGGTAARYLAILLSSISLATLAIAAWMSRGELFTSPSTWLRTSGLAVQLLATITCLAGLLGRSAKEWILQVQDGAREEKWTLPLVVISAIAALSTDLVARQTERTIKGIFPVQTRIRFRDAVSGDPVPSITFGNTPEEPASDPFRFPRRITIDTQPELGAKINGMLCTVTGYAADPFVLTFRSEGMKPVHCTIDPRTPGEVTLHFERE